MSRPALSLRHLGRLLVGVLVFLLVGCGPSHLEVDNEQGRLDEAAPLIEDATTVGQTFVSHRDRLAAVEVLLVVYGEGSAASGELTFHLRTSPADQNDLVTKTLRTGDLAHNQPLRVTFDPLPQSKEQSYYFFFEGTAGSQVTAWYNTIDAYGQGTAVFDGHPRAGDLQFKTFYDYSLDMVVRDVVSGVAHQGGLLPPLGGLLLLPGYLALLLAIPAEEWPDPMFQIALAVGLSVAILPLVLLFATLLGLTLTPALLAVLLIVAGLAAVWRLWALDWQPVTVWRERSNWPALAMFTGLLLLTLVLRMLQARNLVVPAWVDGVHHTMMAQLIADQGQVPATYRPYLDIGLFIYHFGFHTLAAALAWLAELPVHRAVLVMGQVLNAFVGVGVYSLTVTLMRGRPEKRRNAGLIAMGVVGMISLMPAYYVAWGRYTQLTGLVLLPAAVILTLWWAEGGKRWALGLASVAVAGLGVVHYRVLVLYVAFVVALLLYRVISALLPEDHQVDQNTAALDTRPRRPKSFGSLRSPGIARSRPCATKTSYETARNGAPDGDLTIPLEQVPTEGFPPQCTRVWISGYFVRIVALAGLSVLLLSPWIMRLLAALVPTGRGAGWLSGEPSFNAVPRGLIDVGYDRVLLRLALLSLLLGLLWWRRVSILIGLWIAGAVLAANPSLLGGGETWLLSNTVLVIALFLPMAVLTGVLLGTLADTILRWLGGGWRLLTAGLMVAVFSLAMLAGAWNHLDIVNPVTVVATLDDMQAMAWIRENTAPDAGFVTNIRLWQYKTYMGADGGYWIPLLTGRRTLVPPAIYSFGSRSYYFQVQNVLETLAGISKARAPKLQELMSRHKIKYVYLGSKGGPLDLKSFLHDASYTVAYSNGAVRIFRVMHDTEGASK